MQISPSETVESRSSARQLESARISIILSKMADCVPARTQNVCAQIYAARRLPPSGDIRSQLPAQELKTDKSMQFRKEIGVRT